MTSTFRRLMPAIVATLALVTAAAPAAAQLATVPYVSGLSSPVGMVQDPSNPAIQYVVQQGGLVRIIQNGTLLPGEFIDLTAESVSGGERGLLGLAFPADYATSGRFYVYFTSDAVGSTPAGAIVIARFKRSAVNPLQADKTTRFDLVWPAMPDMAGANDCAAHHTQERPFVCKPFTNHNGGKLAFGPDGYLYAGFGDGGSGGDPENQAQRPGTVLGKMVRLDVSVPDNDPRGYRIPADNPFAGADAINALDVIWAFGVRNPWRFTFDNPALGGTGAMVFGDVGQGSFEEINYELPRTISSTNGGRNYGWRIREGLHPFNVGTSPAFTPLTEPMYEYGDAYGDATGATSVTGGYVYRGSALGPNYQGRYFFADYISGRIFSLRLNVDFATGLVVPSDEVEHTAQLNPAPGGNISSIDVDANGELYIVRYGGAILRVVAAGSDTDADTLDDAWEVRFGLNAASGAGADGATGDPDGDGVNNQAELAAGTHPRGLFTRYLAEGASSAGFFDTQIVLSNPAAQPSLALLRFLRENGTQVSRAVTVPGQRRLTIDPAQYASMVDMAYATVVESDREIVVERTMRWDTSGYGAHTEKAVAGPATTWYFAEGAGGFFSTYVLLNNPSASPNDVQIRWLRENGTPLVETVTVPPLTRRTIDTSLIPALRDESFGIEVTFQDAPGIAERAMYFGLPPADLLWKGGHESAGVTAPALEWYLAEGATGPFFETFVLIANPGAQPAALTVTYSTAAGQTITRTKNVPANSRLTINLESEGAPELADAAVATRVVSTNSVPVVVERAQYWPYQPTVWYEAHNSFGVTQPGLRWGLSEGRVGLADDAQTYILLANPGNAASTVTIDFLRETAAPVRKTFVVPANTRTNVSIGSGSMVPELFHERFGANISATNPIVVERAVYTNSNGIVWSAGTNATATRLP